MIRSGALIVCLMFAAAASSALAADPPQPVTTGDVTVATGDLELMLRPLTKAQIAVEADGWLGVLQKKVAEISTSQIAAARLESGAKTKALEAIAKLNDERVSITDRLKIVLAALTVKGGAAAEYETYINAVSGVKVEVTDASAAYTTIMTWLKSPQGGIRYGRNILMFIATLVVFRVIAGIIGNVVRGAMMAFKGTSNLLRDFIVNAVGKITMFVGFVVALSMLEVDIGPFLAAMGAAGFIIGFALQGTLSNFAAGIMILLYRPYDLGDQVTVGGVTGQVEAMTLVSTVVKNGDGHVVTIPNSAIWGGTITRLSAPSPAAAK